MYYVEIRFRLVVKFSMVRLEVLITENLIKHVFLNCAAAAFAVCFSRMASRCPSLYISFSDYLIHPSPTTFLSFELQLAKMSTNANKTKLDSLFFIIINFVEWIIYFKCLFKFSVFPKKTRLISIWRRVFAVKQFD